MLTAMLYKVDGGMSLMELVVVWLQLDDPAPICTQPTQLQSGMHIVLISTAQQEKSADN